MSAHFNYNPHRITRNERACFQLSGDKVAANERKPQQARVELTKSDLSSYWRGAIAQELAKAGAR